MRARILTGLFWGLFIAIVTYVGGLFFDFIYFGIICIGVYELSKVLNNGIKFSYESNLNFLLTLAIIFSKYFIEFDSVVLTLIVYLSITFILFVIDSKFSILRLSHTILIGLYVVVMMYHMTLLNNTPYVWLVYFMAFGTDTFAYFAGVLFGKHKLCPTISPKKTVEGAVGGILGCVIITMIFFFFLDINISFKIIFFSIFVSIFSMFGDLVASKIKREYNIKDYGNFLRGHGGILDRFDSVLFVAPLVYYFIYFII